MSEYDKSLDDIIKQRKIGKGSAQKASSQKVGAKPSPANVKTKVVAGGRVAKPQHFDARSKIGAKGQQKLGWRNNQKQGGVRGKMVDMRDQLAARQRVNDARDKLNQIACRSDARDKLNKIAQRSDARQKLNRLTAPHHHPAQLMNQKINVHQLSLPPPTPNQLTRTVANQNRYMEPPRPSNLMARPASLMPRPSSLMSRPISVPLHGNQKHVLMTKSGIQIIQKQPQLPPRAPPPPPSSLFSRSFSSVTKQDSRPMPELSRSAPSGFPALKRKYEEDFNVPPQRTAFDSQVAKKFLSQMSAAGASRTSQLQSDQSNMNARLQSRLGPGSDSVSPLQGYKVLVANLRSIVTQHDILELFGDIGPLRRAQLLRQGIAEVVYVKLADAQKAVDSYHNRELDGQPMTCRLVNSGTAMTAAADHQLIGYGSSRVGTMHSDRMMSGSVSAKARVVPDAGVIHRALFHGAAPIGAAPRASITVTM